MTLYVTSGAHILADERVISIESRTGVAPETALGWDAIFFPLHPKSPAVPSPILV